jgi:hypothetical protein
MTISHIVTGVINWDKTIFVKKFPKEGEEVKVERIIEFNILNVKLNLTLLKTAQSVRVWYYRLLLRVRYILIARCIPNPANKQRTIPDAILYSTKFITAKTRVKPAYENTTIGRYLLIFSAISIISTISFIRSAVVTCTYLHYHNNNVQQMIIML